MRLALLLSTLLFCSFANAIEIFNAKGEWTFLYNEGRTWNVKTIGIDRDGWPTLRTQTAFDELTYAHASIPRRVIQARAHSLPETSIELGVANGDPNSESLWPIHHQWSWEWEVKYAEWVKSELHAKWWVDHRIATACAEVSCGWSG